METISEFLARTAKERQQRDVAAAGIVISTTDKNPDQFAGDMSLAQDWAKETGKPVPPMPLVEEYRPVFQQQIEAKRNTTVLSSSPKLAEWLQNPQNAALAKDDVTNLGAMEATINAFKRFGMSFPQTYYQAMASRFAGQAQDAKRTFGEILYDEREAYFDRDGNEIGRGWVRPDDAVSAGWRYLTSRWTDAVTDPEAQAQRYQMAAGEIRRAISETPMTAGAQAAAERLTSINTGSVMGDVSEFISTVGQDPAGFASFLAQVAAESVPAIGASVGVGLVTRNPSASAATMGALSASREYGASATEFLEEKGYDITTAEGALAAIRDEDVMREANSRGLTRGLVIGAMDTLSFTLAGVRLAESPFLNAVAQSVAQAAMGAGGEAAGQVASGQQFNIVDVIIEGMAEFVTAPIEVGAAGVTQFRQSQAKAAAAADTQAKIAEIAQQSMQSKLRARMPDVFRAWVEKATENGPAENLYVPADKFTEYFQGAGLDPFALADELDGVTRSDLETALFTGGDLRIPTATYAAKLAGSDADQFFMENMRFDPDEFTSAEARAFEDTKAELMAEAQMEAERAFVEQQELRTFEEQIYDSMVERLRTAGRATDVAKPEASLYPAFYKTWAQRTGIPLDEFIRRYPLPQVRGDIPQGMQPKNVDELTRTLATARAQRQAAVNQPNTPLLEFISNYGGISDMGGELAARDAALIRRGRGRKNLRLQRDAALPSRDAALRGYGPDDVAMAAIEAGFMADNPVVQEYKTAMERGDQVPDVSLALWEEIDKELGGQASMTDDDMNAGSSWDDTIAELDRYLGEIGMSLDDSDADIRAAIERDQAERGRMYGQDGQIATDSEAFKAWFGDSKVVDADGKPLVVYHGTRAAFEAFDPQKSRVSWASETKALANEYADIRGYGVGDIMPLYMRVEKPFNADLGLSPISTFMEMVGAAIEQSGSDVEGDAVLGGLIDSANSLIGRNQSVGFSREMFWFTPEQVFGNNGANAFIDILKHLGFDGITVLERGDQTWGAFNPTQIKSVNNRGTFDANDPRILFQEQRGSVAFPSAGVGNGETVISLFRKADLSTFLHESGHYFLTVMQDLAAKGEASAVAEFDAVKAEWRKNADAVAKDAMRVMPDVQITVADVIQALDNGTTGDVLKDAAIDIGMQEQFARGFEAYLLEGKAPSVELRGAFEKFRAWLLSVYKSLRGLNVDISPEMRGVFDRMLATDDEIAQARQTTGDVGPMFKDAPAGMSAEDFERYRQIGQQAQDEAAARLLAETMAPIKREAEAAYRAEKAAVRAEVEPVINARKEYRAFEWMANRRMLGGDQPTGLSDMRMSRQVLVERYGEGVLKTLPRGRFTVYANEGGVDPDVAAGMFGFSSGDELIRALEQAPKRTDAINAEVEKVMFERHGDPLRDGTVEAKALEAVHGDKRARVLALELDILRAQPGGTKSAVSVFREMARGTLANMRVRDAMAANRYLASERKAGEASYRAFSNGDLAGAAEAKRRQLLNHMLYSESLKVSENVNSILDKAAKLNRSEKKMARTNSIDHIKAARAIAARFEMARPDSTFDFAMWVEQLKFDDPIAADALTSAIETYSQNARNYKVLTVSEIGAVSDAIENILANGKRLRTLEIQGQKVDRDIAKAELIDIIEARGPSENKALSRRLSYGEKTKVGALSILSSLRRMEAWARDMDDGKQGPFTKYLVRPVMDALGEYRTDRTKRLQELLDIINERKESLLGKAVAAPELNYTFENKGELLHAILHRGNPSNFEKLLLGRGWSSGLVGQTQATTKAGRFRVDRKGNPIMTRGNVDTSRWDAFMDRMIKEGTLTKEDFDTAQSIWDLMESTKRPAQAAFKKIYGHYFNEVEAEAFDTPFGTYRGGYVPAIADMDASNDGQIRADQAAMEAQATSFMFPTTGSGFTKSRVQNYNTPLALNLTLLPSHLDKVLRFTHLDPVIRQTGSLVNDRELRASIDGLDKSILPNLVVPWLQRTAQQAVEAQPTTPAGRVAARLWSSLRRRVGVHTMFLNLTNAAQQVTGFSTAMVLVKPSLVKAATIRFVRGGADQMRSEVFAVSPYMADRIKNASRETQARIQDAITEPTKLGDIKLFIERHGYFLQTAFQNFVDVPVWHAAYDQAVGNGLSHADAVFEADSVIRRSMSAMDAESVSLFESGAAFTRLFTMFYSYFNGQANLIGGEMQTVMRTMGWRGSGRMFWIYVFGIAIPAIAAEAIVQAARGELLDDEDEDGYLDDISSLFFGSQIRYNAAMVPVAGQVGTAAFNRFNDQFYDDRISTSPVLSAVERAIGAPATIGSAVLGDGDASRAVGDGLTALGLILGIPTGWLAKTSGYIIDVAEGDAEPEGVVDLLQGVVSGRDGTAR